MKNNVMTFIGCESTYDMADTVIFGAPFDSTTSYRPGTRFASRSIRSESFSIETYSPYQDMDLEDISVFDAGDLELCFGNSFKALTEIENFTKEILQAKKLPLMIGGEHLVTLGAVRAASEAFPGLKMIHFDAHTDLREAYLGERFSHATVIKRCWELLGDKNIYQYGIRSGERSEFLWAKEHTHLQKFNLDTLSNAIEEIGSAPVYLTIDLDVLDPSEFPGTGTPEAGGVTFTDLLNALISLSNLNIVGADLNELAPIYDIGGASTSLACKILRELLLIVTKKR